MASRGLPDISAVKQEKKTSLMSVPVRISAHVALEFYEESKDKYFIIGAVVDSASEGQETTVRYLMENTRISDDLFLYGNQVKSIAEFRGSNIDIRQWCKTNVEARRMVTARLGRIEDKFFRLIPKALAFKPIDDIKDFVYSYVLDEKEVNIVLNDISVTLRPLYEAFTDDPKYPDDLFVTSHEAEELADGQYNGSCC